MLQFECSTPASARYHVMTSPLTYHACALSRPAYTFDEPLLVVWGVVGRCTKKNPFQVYRLATVRSRPLYVVLMAAVHVISSKHRPQCDRRQLPRSTRSLSKQLSRNALQLICSMLYSNTVSISRTACVLSTNVSLSLPDHRYSVSGKV